MKSISGFTLIELMIVIAILGILMAIAIPTYQSYAIRSRVTECVNVSSAAKLAVSQVSSSLGTLAAVTQARSAYSFAASTYCAAVNILDGGTIQLTTQATGANTQPVLRLIPTSAAGRLMWQCTLVAGSATHVPAVCRP